MANRELGPMSVGAILSRSFQLYGEQFVPLAVIVCVVYVPVWLVEVARKGLKPNAKQWACGELCVAALVVFLLLSLLSWLVSAMRPCCRVSRSLTRTAISR